ncbi:hypothetical protein METP1_03244 [Methanosarcinales archaeon]|nr:hypothetical protein METP1_03244 [Methanosarcinales archaeon]
MGTVNPDTGFYQVFVKNTKYDGRSVIVGLAGKSFSVSSYILLEAKKLLKNSIIF